ncbi:MAG: DUF3327 domain-containing protein [Propioniciclava sp.]|uniref:alpha/beta hydrolase n=1 Tax=Propioniciclava sp. TaxID=2038686 RepID=UPI0039E30763
MTENSRVPGGGRPLREWRDRHGVPHQERRAAPRTDEPRVQRVVGPLEAAWRKGNEPGAQSSVITGAAGDGDHLVESERHSLLAQEALERPNPHIEPDPDDSERSLWTWVIEDADARAIVLWVNPVFDFRDAREAEFTRLPGSDLWTICLRLSSALRASYRIASWYEEGPPPWRTAVGRRNVILAARDPGLPDPRGVHTIRGSWGQESSIGAGPLAPVELWRVSTERPAPASSRLDELTLPDGERAWVYSPGQVEAPTPLLVLFDGQVWKGVGLPEILDIVIAAGHLPPLHVALLDSRDRDHRWAKTGVPGGQVDTVIDHLLPRVRANWAVDPSGDSTLVSGQSLGGMASLWTLALSEGEVQHAIAQSASLWRFDIAEPLLNEPRWRSLELQAGTCEGAMLPTAQALEASLRADQRLGHRTVRTTGFEAGHDWAVWRANLINTLADRFRPQTAVQQA